jgi:hypothetical protein
MTTRRGFITGLISFVAAPAIVRAESLMKLPRPRVELLEPYGRSPVLAALQNLRDAEEALYISTAIPMAEWRLMNQARPEFDGFIDIPFRTIS